MKPIDYQDFVLIKDFEHGQLDIALKFREAVFGDDLNALISLLSKEDLERLKGRFEGLKEVKPLANWDAFLSEIHTSLKERWDAIKDDYNTSTSIRYTDQGEGIFFFFEAGNEGIKNGGEILKTYHVAIIPEIEFSVVNEEPNYTAVYKVKIFDSLEQLY